MAKGPRIENDHIQKIVSFLKKAKSILFITGAGVSADSGLPTYRGIGGLYNDQTTEEGIPIETALAGEMLARRPEITWKYIAKIEENCRGARFNRAHEAMAEMEDHFERVWVLTQNIDGFHFDAGSRHVIDLHGNVHHLLCTRCSWSSRVKDYSGLKIPPLCPECHSFVRPDVVFFGEMLPTEKTQLLYQELSKGFDLTFSIGTTSVFPYISSPVMEAKRRGKPTVEINPGHTEVSDIVDIKMTCGAAQGLDRIWKEYQKNRSL